MAFPNNDIMTQIGQDVEFRRNWDAVVLNIEQMGCEWEELREPIVEGDEAWYRRGEAGEGDVINFVEYLQDEDYKYEIEWMPDFDWGYRSSRNGGWDTEKTAKGRAQRDAMRRFWDEVGERSACERLSAVDQSDELWYSSWTR